MQKDKINIFVIGTCRAFRITKTASKGKDDLSILNRGDVFFHSTKEILNIIDYQARKKISAKHRKYMTLKPEMIPRQENADLFIIEISSNRCVKYEGNYFKFVNNNVPKARERQYIIPKKEMVRDIALMVEKLNKPVIFVSHLNILKPDGKPIIEQRHYMAEIVKESALFNKAYFFNPSTYFDQTNWLDYVDKELYHYTPLGQEIVGKHFYNYIREVAKNEKW